MEKIFFSKENFGIIYNILKDKIQTQLKFDISSNQKFHKELINIIKAVYQQRSTFNLPSNTSLLDTSRYLSQKSINVALSYFTENINKITTTTNVDQLQRDMDSGHQNLHNKLDSRPLSTQQQQHSHTNGTSNVMSSFNKLLSERDAAPNTMPTAISFKEPNNDSNNDIQTKYNIYLPHNYLSYATTRFMVFYPIMLVISKLNFRLLYILSDLLFYLTLK